MTTCIACSTAAADLRGVRRRWMHSERDKWRERPPSFFSILVLGASDANCPWKISEKKRGGKQSFLVVANLASSYFDALINCSIFQVGWLHLGTLETQFHKNTTHNIAIVSSFLQDVTHTPLQCLYWYWSTFQIFDLGFDWRWCFSNHIFVMAVRATHVECTAVGENFFSGYLVKSNFSAQRVSGCIGAPSPPPPWWCFNDTLLCTLNRK